MPEHYANLDQAAGDLGTPVLKAILDSGKFNVTILTRPESKSTFPAGVEIVRADYASIDALTSALRGQDAVVSTLGTGAILGQSVLVDAAIAAGVKRILPAEFGSDYNNPKAAALPVFGYKVVIRKHIEDKVAAGANITYTYVTNSVFLDWGLNVGFLLDLKSPEPKLYNNGEYIFSTTTLASVGQAVVGVLSNPDETKNRSVFVEDLAISQKRILELAQKVAPEKKWTPVNVNLDDLGKWAYGKLAEGDYSLDVMYTFINLGVFQDGYGSRFEKLDNELLGVTGKSEADVEDLIRNVLAGN